MEYIKKENYSETCYSNISKHGPLVERMNESLSYNKIQELTSVLIQKKAEFRECKLIRENLLGKSEQQ
jgi:hypothetical protein